MCAAKSAGGNAILGLDAAKVKSTAAVMTTMPGDDDGDAQQAVS
jgi:hypothetical protein